MTRARAGFSLDDLRRAAAAGVIDAAAVGRLEDWRRRAGQAQSAAAVESPKGLNFVSVAYYAGALLMISACAWFLADQWESLGSGGILAVTLVYAAIALGAGLALRRHGYVVGGGLLVTVAVSLTPLATYSMEDLLGWWPSADPGAYKNYYPLVNGSWIGMEIATILVAALALRFVRFGFLVAPLAFSAWFLSMDLWGLLRERGELDWDEQSTISVLVGIAILAIGGALDRWRSRLTQARAEDFAFWLYLFGLLAFWGGLTSQNSNSELGRFFYLLINLVLIGIGVTIRRTTFLAFGAMGAYLYLGHLAYEVFKHSVLFPFALILLGFGMIAGAVFAQRRGWLRAR